jgi:D-amino-acid dehydrogenase
MRTTDSDVLVLGGGVIGLACAYYLLRDGRSVTVLEQGTVGSGSSHGNCGTLTPSHSPPLPAPGMITKALKWMLTPDAPFFVRPGLDAARWRWLLHAAARCNPRDYSAVNLVKGPLLLRSRQLIEQLVAEEKLDCEFAADGSLYVFRDARELDRSIGLIEDVRAAGMDMHLWDGPEAERREPALKPGVAGALFNPQDAHLRPDRYVAELARVVRARGGRIEERTPITGIDARAPGPLVVATERGAFRGGRTVLALGAWSPQFATALGVRVPIQPGKGYSITYTRPGLAPRRPLVLKERSVCVTAWSSGFRLGSTMEFTGYDATLNRRRLDALERGAREYLIEPHGAQKQEEWYGWRPMTYDDLPIIGRARARDDLVLATGHGMLGVTLSAVTGELVAQIVAGGETSLDVAPFSPTRFD